jgi:hypothetical protein
MYAPLFSLVGNQQPIDVQIPDTTQRFPLGMQQDMVDEFYGWGAFVYGKAVQACGVGRLCFMDSVWGATDIPNTANTGFPIYIARANMAINTFGWFQFAGQMPMLATASVAAGVAIGITAAGSVGANTAGKQVLNARVVRAGTATIVIANVGTVNGSPLLQMPNIGGLFVGLTASGTGISGTISAMDPNQNRIQLSANASATGNITATFTYTNFLGVQSTGAFVQGAIT